MSLRASSPLVRRKLGEGRGGGSNNARHAHRPCYPKPLCVARPSHRNPPATARCGLQTERRALLVIGRTRSPTFLPTLVRATSMHTLFSPRGHIRPSGARTAGRKDKRSDGWPVGGSGGANVERSGVRLVARAVGQSVRRSGVRSDGWSCGWAVGPRSDPSRA